MLTADDPRAEAWTAADEIEVDPTGVELAHALPDGATVVVVGWPEVAGEALPRRGDVEVLAVDSLGEASGLVRRLQRAGVDAIDVQPSGLGAAVRESDLLVLEAVALGPTGALAVAGSFAAATVARECDVPVWLVAGCGRLLPARLWDAIATRLDARPGDPWDLDEEIVPLTLIDRICTSAGSEPPAEAVARIDTPIAPELLRGGSAPGTYSQ